MHTVTPIVVSSKRFSGVTYATIGALAVAALAYRVQDLGRYGFWNDEAWVALSTRVAGFAQFRLSLGPTPILWAAALRPLAHLPIAPEVALRLLPLAFALLTVGAAWRTAGRLGGLLAGLVALAAIGLDPLSIEYAKLLKQYGAEACLALVAFSAAARFVAAGRTRDLVHLSAATTVGLGFANSQLFVAPPLFAALAADGLARRDGRRVRNVLLAGAAVALFAVAWFRLLIAPHLNAALSEYWVDAYVPATAGGPAFALRALRMMLEPTWGPVGLVVAVGALAAACALDRALAVMALATALLFAELALLSARRLLPFAAARVMLFALTALDVHLAAGVGVTVRRLWDRGRLRPLAVAVLAIVAADVARSREWATLGRAAQVEDLGPLVRTVERERRPDDGILVYQRSVFVYAYYQDATPVLVPAATSVGWVPRIDDPRVVLVQGPDAAGAIARAVGGHPRLWFLGSRFAAGDEARIRRALAGRRLVREATRPRALLLLVER